MLRLSITLLLLVGAAFSESQNGWKDGKQYTYTINSRTLASFNELSRQYSGIVMEGQLQVQANGPETLRAKISQAQYSPIHTRLDKGWESEIPRDQLNMQSFPLSNEPFEIKVKRGVVKDLIVDKNLPTWQVNILKSIVGQLQVDTQGENAEKSKHNQLPEGKQPYAVYKTMEDSVGGKCEVLYDISPILPAHMLQSKPELAPMPELREDGDFISVVKSKNYSNCDQRVSYHFGVNGRNDWEPGSNENGKYLSRSSISRIILSGDVKKYTIQSSVTSNKVVLNPDQREDQQAMISSKMELRLNKVNDVENKISAPSDPTSTGNLVYDYNNPFEKESRHAQSSRSKSHDKNKKNKEQWRDSDSSYEIDTDASREEEDSELQPKPTMTEPPHNPMLPFFIGNNGKSIITNNKVDAVKTAKSIAREIGNEMVHYDKMPEEGTLEKFTILTRLIRLMNAEQIGEVGRELYEPPRSATEQGPPSEEQKARRNTWAAFRDAVANAGTGPALVNIKKWVQEKRIKDDETAKVIDSIAKSTRTPTPEYLETFLEMLKLREVIDPPVVCDNAHQSYAELLRHAVVNKKSAHNRFPVHAFGKFYGKNIHFLHAKYFPYMAAELQDGFDKKDSIKVQVLISAIGRTGHPRMLSLFEPYIEGKKDATPYERFFMVISMYRLATVYPKTARSVLYKIYSNTDDHYEIRTAAVYLLMNTNPPASMLQRMADFTNYDSSKQVNSAVKSSIESLARLSEHETRGVANAARAALPLLTKEIYGPQYSRGLFSSRKDPISHTGYSLEAYYIGSEDSIIPKGVSITLSPTHNGMKMPKIQLAGAVSKIQDLYDALQKELGMKGKNNGKAEQKKYSPENLAKMLGINAGKPQLLEGFISVDDATNTVLFSYTDKETGNSGEQLDNLLVDLPEKLRRMQKNLSKGVSFDDTVITSNEMTISFPTETGYPLTFSLKVPTILKLIGQSKAQFESDNDQSPVPKSAAVTAKVHFIQGMKMQKRLSFVIPFEHQEYISGVDKNVQLHLPFLAEMEYNKNKQEARLKVQPNNEEPQFKLVQMKIEPFTSKHDILSLKPVSTDANTRIIFKDSSKPLHVESNDNKQSLQFSWEIPENLFISGDQSPLKKQMAMLATNKMARAVGSMYALSPQEDTEYQWYSVGLAPDSNVSVEMKISYDSLVKDSSKNDEQESTVEENEGPKGKAPRLERNMSEEERKQKMLREVSKNIESAEASVIDVNIKVNEANTWDSVTFTAAVATSYVDERARMLMYASTKIPFMEYFISAGVESKSPNYKTMDYEETLKANKQHEFDGEIKYGPVGEEGEAEVINLNGRAKQTEGFKNQIRQSRQAQECSKEVNKSGNKLTAACQKVNERAIRVNAGDLIITFQDGSPIQGLTMGAVDKARYTASSLLGSALENRNRHEKGEKNKIKFSFEVSPNEDSLDLSVTTPDGRVTPLNVKWPNAPLSEYENNDDDKEKEPLENLMAPFSTCALDKSQVKTFDNHRYGVQLGQCWHVAMTPFPKNDYFRPGHHKEIPEDKHFAVMARDNADDHKELKITIGEKEIELSSRGDRKVEVKVDGEKIKLSKRHAYQENKNGEVVLEIVEFPDKSVKLVSEKYEIELMYDGSRAVIQAADKYRDSVRGLCGDYNGEPENDQKTPKGCLLEKPEEFAATYALVSEDQCQGPARQNAEKAKQSECIDDDSRPGNVISDKEAGRKHRSSSSEESDDSSENANCTKRRTMVSRSDDEICFSVKPVLSCASDCRPTDRKSKDVAFHCVRRSATSERIAQRVEKGANPDLTQKKVSKTESHMVPIGCKA